MIQLAAVFPPEVQSHLTCHKTDRELSDCPPPSTATALRHHHHHHHRRQRARASPQQLHHSLVKTKEKLITASCKPHSYFGTV